MLKRTDHIEAIILGLGKTIDFPIRGTYQQEGSYSAKYSYYTGIPRAGIFGSSSDKRGQRRLAGRGHAR